MQAPQALIFDLDGLVLDTEPGYRAAWRYAAEQMGLRLGDDIWQGLSGAAAEQVHASLLAYAPDHFNLSEFQRVSGAYWRQQVLAQGIAVMPGLHQLLALVQQRRLPYALATNSPLQAAKFCLQCADLSDSFTCIISRDQVNQPKPAPDIILAAAASLSVSAVQCWLLEDSWTGIQAGLAAGAQCVWVGAQAQSQQSHAKIAASLTEVADWLAALSS